MFGFSELSSSGALLDATTGVTGVSTLGVSTACICFIASIFFRIAAAVFGPYFPSGSNPD